MKYEGYAVLANEAVQHELAAAGHADIRVAGLNENRRVYDTTYEFMKSGGESMSQAANDIGQFMKNFEHVKDGRTYHDYYAEQHSLLGGH